ncbi:MAG: hypothetical protein AAGI23_17530 [Bacteroidota bacterium]
MTTFNFKFAALFAFAILFFASCEEDTIGGGVDDVAPSISLVSEAGFISGDATQDVGAAIKFKVDVRPGSSDLNTLTIFEDGSRVPLARINLSANPLLIVDTDAKENGATYEIEVTPDANIIDAGVYTYSAEVADDAGEIATTSFILTTENPLTALTNNIEGVLLNQAGPAGTGGLDLSTGESVGSNDPAADIQDEGIDEDITVANNWRRQISGANGASVVFVDDIGKVAEGLTFETVEFKEQIVDAFTSGLTLAGDDADCNCTDNTSGEEVSDVVQVGDIFAVSSVDNTTNTTTIYLIQCTDVTMTDTGNSDSYTFDIKY